MAAKLLLLAVVVGTPAVALIIRQTEPDDLVSVANDIHDLAKDLAGSSVNLVAHGSLADAHDFGAFGAFGASKAKKASTVAAVFEAFRKGKFKGSACKKNAASLFTKDAVIDNRAGPREKDYFKKFSPGVVGLCDYFAKAYRFTLHGLKTTQYARDKEIVQVLHYRPGIGSQKAKDTMTQWNVISFNADGTKLAGMKVIMDKDNLYNMLTMDIEMAKTTKQETLVKKLRVLFDKGKFKKRVAYGRCMEYVQKYYTADAVIDWRGGGTKDVKYFKKFPAGAHGVCEWYTKEYSHIKTELKTDMYARGDDVMLRLKFRPQGLFDGPVTKDAVLQQMVVKFNKDGSQVRGIDGYFDRQDVWDQFYIENSGRPHDRPSTVAAVFNAFGLEKFKGGTCKKEVKKLFTKDAVIDNTGPKDESYFMKHRVGFDGVCDYFNKAYTSGYGMKNLNSTLYSRGKDIVQVLKYQPVKGKKTGADTVTQFNVFRFGKFGRKMARFDALIDKPVLYDKLLHWNAPPSSAPAMAPAPAIAAAPGQGPAAAPAPAMAPAPAALYLPRYPVTKRIELFQQVRHAYAKRDFRHMKACVKATGNFFTADAVIDFRGGGTIKVDYFALYPAGLEGVCKWYQEEYHHLRKDLTIDMYQRGDDVLVRQRYRPQVLNHGPSTTDFVIQEMLVKYNKEGTKITRIENFFDRTDVWDEMVELDLYGKRLEAPCEKVKCGVLDCPAPFKLKMDETCCGYCWAPDSKVALDRHRAGSSMGFAIEQCERAPAYCRGPGPSQVKCFKTSCVAGEEATCADGSCCPSCTRR